MKKKSQNEEDPSNKRKHAFGERNMTKRVEESSESVTHKFLEKNTTLDKTRNYKINTSVEEENHNQGDIHLMLDL